MKLITTVGIVGAGTMGSALAQKFAQEGFKVILADRANNFVEKGIGNIASMLNEGIAKNVFTQAQVDSFLSNLKGTSNLEDLKQCDLVIEAIFENFDAKKELFQTLSTILSPTTIVATNTSSFSVSELAKFISCPGRFIGLHFFYHAAKNRLVEIIRGNQTSDETYDSITRFSALAGKDAITCADAYGFVVNRFFVPWLNEAVRLLEESVASIEAIDEVCMKTFGIGMGPFALMNATGVPVAYHSEKTLEIFGPLYTTSALLKVQAESGKQWNIDTAKKVTVDDITRNKINERMLGVVFYVCTQLLDEKVCSATEINRGAKIGLKWRKGPIDLMNEQCVDLTTKLIKKISQDYKVTCPKSIGSAFWETINVKLSVKNDVAVIRMDQPENLNALSEVTMNQLNQCMDDVNQNPEVKTIYLVGSGKAFVAGADIKFFVKNIKSDRICEIESFTEFGQNVFNKIDNSPKKVVAIINGLALGGGLELALCADIILALPKAQMAFPETSIGIYPGLGGTQRSTRKIGKALSKYLIYTGKSLSALDALELGLIDKIIDYHEMYDLLEGRTRLDKIEKHPLNAKWEAIRSFFESYTLHDLLNDKCPVDSSIESDKMVKTIKYKAPIALKLADKLITEAKGCDSELNYLREIFSTSDALLGLTSIGQKVEYTGH